MNAREINPRDQQLVHDFLRGDQTPMPSFEALGVEHPGEARWWREGNRRAARRRPVRQAQGERQTRRDA